MHRLPKREASQEFPSAELRLENSNLANLQLHGGIITKIIIMCFATFEAEVPIRKRYSEGAYGFA